MKKHAHNCTDCGVDGPILTQVSSGPEIIFLCSDCYNFRFSNEAQEEIKYIEKKNKKT